MLFLGHSLQLKAFYTFSGDIPARVSAVHFSLGWPRLVASLHGSDVCCLSSNARLLCSIGNLACTICHNGLLAVPRASGQLRAVV
jgi:hypothetical protein